MTSCYNEIYSKKKEQNYMFYFIYKFSWLFFVAIVAYVVYVINQSLKNKERDSQQNDNKKQSKLDSHTKKHKDQE